jgi:hypothetical protein
MLTVRAAADVINLEVLNTRSYPLEEYKKPDLL